MSIAAFITEGVGPGGSIKYLLTGGLDIGAPPVVHNAYFSAFTLMRSTPEVSAGTMRNAPVPSIGAVANTLSVMTLMRSTPAPASGGMRNSPIVSQGAIP